MPARTLELEFPLGGLSRLVAFQKQRPFTTPFARNVRPEGPIEKRTRGGGRPGLVKSFSTRDSNNPVNMLAIMRSLNTEGRAVFADAFSSGANWEEWTETGFTLPTFKEDAAFATPPSINGAHLVSGSIPSINTNAPFSLESRILIYKSAFTKGYSFYLGMNDAAPDPASSVSVEIAFSTDANNADTRIISILKNDVVLAADVSLADLVVGLKWIRFEVLPTGIVRVFFMDDFILEHDTAFSPSGNNAGFLIKDLFGLAASKIEDINIRYISSGGGVPPEAVLQATNGILRRENTEGALAKVTQTGITLVADSDLLAVDRLGKLYIADHGNRVGTSGADLDVELRLTDGVVSGTSFDSASVTDWTKYGIETAGDWLEILAGSGPTLGLYKITTVASGNLTLASSPGDGSSLTFRVTRGPKVYDSNTDAMTRWEPTTGSIPLGCTIIEIFKDRAVFGGDPEQTGIYFMSRSGDFDDFNYGASPTDFARAVSDITSSSDGGQLSVPMSAIAAITEDYCMFSGESELYLLRGDPTLGGIMGNISRQIGIGSRTAWCRIPDGSLVFLSRDGLYKFHPSHPFPQSMSRERLPEELIDVVQNTSLVVTLEYDVRFRGVHIYVTTRTAGPTNHYWFDWPTQSFWLVELGETAFEATSIVYDAKANHVLLGGRDGHVRHYDSAALNDDGTAVTKEVDYGPIPLNRGRAAMAESLEIILDDGSDDVSWTFRSGNSPEEANGAAPRASGTAKAGVNYRQSVRHYGEYGFLRLSTTGSVRWAVEAIRLRVLTTPAESRKI